MARSYFEPKIIQCEITSVKKNTDEYDDEYFESIDIPKIGSITNEHRAYWYPFKSGDFDGYSVLPRSPIVNKKGEPSKKWTLYVSLKQIKLVD